MRTEMGATENRLGLAENLLDARHRGAFAFEYIIVLVIMAVVIFAAWRVLGNAVTTKAQQIADFILNNGQTELGRG